MPRQMCEICGDNPATYVEQCPITGTTWMMCNDCKKFFALVECEMLTSSEFSEMMADEMLDGDSDTLSI